MVIEAPYPNVWGHHGCTHKKDRPASPSPKCVLRWLRIWVVWQPVSPNRLHEHGWLDDFWCQKTHARFAVISINYTATCFDSKYPVTTHWPVSQKWFKGKFYRRTFLWLANFFFVSCRFSLWPSQWTFNIHPLAI